MIPRWPRRRCLAAPLLALLVGAPGLVAAQAPPAAASCIACHGAQGEGQAAPGYPRLAGLPADYLQRQLQAYAGGMRANPIMTPLARAMSAAERDQVAAYFSALPAPARAASAAPVVAADVAELALRGRWSEGLPGCMQCHGPQGVGVGAIPPLSGQPARYLAAQLQAWQGGKRPPGPLGLMASVAARLSAADVAALANHFGTGPRAVPGPAAVEPARAVATGFVPPPLSTIPDNEFGKVVRQGLAIFEHTGTNAPAFSGNALACVNCHLDAGRLAGASPLWAAYLAYPAYRAKNGHVNTFEERMQGCFRFSMNGKAPPLGSPTLVALQSYAYWLASGARVDPNLPGRGYPKLAKPASAPDRARGEKVFAADCAFCHGPEGQGQQAGAVQVFPPLWGPRSFNWGAGMGSVANAAAFVKANMPLGRGGSLSDQDAWDVALFMDSHERPQDPRFVDSVAVTRQRFHDSPMSMYGRRVDGVLLGEQSVPAGGSTVH